MAKQKISVKQYFEQLTKETGLDDTTAAAVLAALENEKFRGKVEEFGMLRSEYSQKHDELAEDKKKWQKWYSEEAKPYVKQAEVRLAKYESTYGPIEDIEATGDPRVMKTATGDFVSRDEVQELLRANTAGLAGAVSQFVKGISKYSVRHFKTFGEELDTDELEQFMQERGISEVEAGYREYVQPKLEERREDETKKKIAEAREEAVREFKAKHNFPENPQPSSTKIPVFETEESAKETAVPRVGRLQKWTEIWNKHAGEASAE